MTERPASRLRSACGPTEIVTAGYLVITALLLVIFHENQPAWLRHVVLHVALLAVLLWLVTRTSSQSWSTVRLLQLWYPLPLFLILYHEVGQIVHLIQPGFVDGQLISVEQRLFGMQPSIRLAQNGPSWLADVMLLAYSAYWWYGPIVGAYIYLHAGASRFRQFVFRVSLAMYVSYLLFLLLPAEGPRFALREAGATLLPGSFIAATVNRIVATEGLRGGAFPSSHVAVMVAVVWSAWRSARRLAPAGTLIACLLTISVVYGRFHYAIDAIAGLVLGVALCAVADAILMRSSRHEVWAAETIVPLRMPSATERGAAASRTM
jgi:hypothetical protein